MADTDLEPTLNEQIDACESVADRQRHSRTAHDEIALRAAAATLRELRAGKWVRKPTDQPAQDKERGLPLKYGGGVGGAT